MESTVEISRLTRRFWLVAWARYYLGLATPDQTKRGIYLRMTLAAILLTPVIILWTPCKLIWHLVVGFLSLLVGFYPTREFLEFWHGYSAPPTAEECFANFYIGEGGADDNWRYFGIALPIILMIATKAAPLIAADQGLPFGYGADFGCRVVFFIALAVWAVCGPIAGFLKCTSPGQRIVHYAASVWQAQHDDVIFTGG